MWGKDGWLQSVWGTHRGLSSVWGRHGDCRRREATGDRDTSGQLWLDSRTGSDIGGTGSECSRDVRLDGRTGSEVSVTGSVQGRGVVKLSERCADRGVVLTSTCSGGVTRLPNTQPPHWQSPHWQSLGNSSTWLHLHQTTWFKTQLQRDQKTTSRRLAVYHLNRWFTLCSTPNGLFCKHSCLAAAIFARTERKLHLMQQINNQHYNTH